MEFILNYKLHIGQEESTYFNKIIKNIEDKNLQSKIIILKKIL